MSESSVPYLRIAALLTVIGLSSIAPGYGQTEKGAFEVGIEAGPFLAIATGGHETVGVIGLAVEPHAGFFLTDALVVGATGFFYRGLTRGRTKDLRRAYKRQKKSL